MYYLTKKKTKKNDNDMKSFKIKEIKIKFYLLNQVKKRTKKICIFKKIKINSI